MVGIDPVPGFKGKTFTVSDSSQMAERSRPWAAERRQAATHQRPSTGILCAPAAVEDGE